jgi:hypothetical protein
LNSMFANLNLQNVALSSHDDAVAQSRNLEMELVEHFEPDEGKPGIQRLAAKLTKKP